MKVKDLVSDFDCRIEDIYESLKMFDFIDSNQDQDDFKNFELEIQKYVKALGNDRFLTPTFLENFLKTEFKNTELSIHSWIESPDSFIHRYGVFNYRTFPGASSVALKPITLLFGPNSSGKSCFLRSFLSSRDSTEASLYKPNPKTNSYMLKEGNSYGFSYTFKKEAILHAIEEDELFLDKFNFQCYKLLEKPMKKIKTITLRELRKPGSETMREILDFQVLINDIVFFENRNSKLVIRESWKNGTQAFMRPLVSEFITSAFGIKKQNNEIMKEGRRLISAMLNSCVFDGHIVSTINRPVDSEEKANLQESWVTSIRAIKAHDDYNGSSCTVEKFGDHVVKVLNILLDTLFQLKRKLIESVVYLGPIRPIPKPYFTLDEHLRQSGKTEWDLLLEDSNAIDYVNDWMSGIEKLDMGYIMVREVFEKSDTYIGSFDELERLYSEKPKVKEWLNSISNDQKITFLKIRDLKRHIDLDFSEVGVGVSQILPIIVACYASNREGKQICIEQPELHLHPSLQAKLGDLFIESALGYNAEIFQNGPDEEDFESFEDPHPHSLMIETHSEHLILRILRRIKETTLYKEQGIEFPEGFIPVTPEDVAVHYVSPGEEGSTIKELPITNDGDFAENWPNGFFDERLDELV